MSGHRILQKGGDFRVRHTVEVIVGRVVTPHVVKAEMIIFAVLAAPLWRLVLGLLRASFPLAFGQAIFSGPFTLFALPPRRHPNAVKVLGIELHSAQIMV